MEARVREPHPSAAPIEVGARELRTNLAQLLAAAEAGTPIIVTRPNGTRLRLGLERDLETPLERAVREGWATAGKRAFDRNRDTTPRFLIHDPESAKRVMDLLREDRE